MKKIFLLLFLFFPAAVYPFWIWSPKTQEWKNPEYSALATPYLQYRKALDSFEAGDHKRAFKEFKKLIAHYPDAKEAAEAQYYLARSLEYLNKHYEAFLEYEKLIDSYPNSQRINEAVEREYNIGEFFLNREAKKVLGLSVYDFVEHPSINIFTSIVKKTPYSEYAARAQYKLGIIFVKLGRFEEAREAFQKVIDNYPDSEWAEPSKYQLAIATARAFPGTDYDSSNLKEATHRLNEFIQKHPDAQISGEAEVQLGNLRSEEAKKAFEIGEFYEKQSKYESAVMYYSKVMKSYPDTGYFEAAKSRIVLLESLLSGRISEKEYRKMDKSVPQKTLNPGSSSGAALESPAEIGGETNSEEP